MIIQSESAINRWITENNYLTQFYFAWLEDVGDEWNRNKLSPKIQQLSLTCNNSFFIWLLKDYRIPPQCRKWYFPPFLLSNFRGYLHSVIARFLSNAISFPFSFILKLQLYGYCSHNKWHTQLIYNIYHLKTRK